VIAVYKKVAHKQLDGKKYTRNRGKDHDFKGEWAVRQWCTFAYNQKTLIHMSESQYTVEGALANCAFKCDDSKNCFFANLERNHNTFICHPLGDCNKTRSTSTSILSENGKAFYKKA